MLDGFLRVIGRLAIAVQRPAVRDALAFAHRHHDAPAHYGSQREVDEDRLAACARKHRRHRVGAEERLLAAPRRDRRRRIGERKTDQAGARHRQEMDAEDADVRAVLDAAEGDDVAPRALDHLVDRELDRDVRQAVGVVDQAGAGAIGDKARLGGAVGTAAAQHAAIERDARHAVYDVVGPVCETTDLFARDRDLAELEAGNLVAFLTAL